jgi:hypothetical protein
MRSFWALSPDSGWSSNASISGWPRPRTPPHTDIRWLVTGALGGDHLRAEADRGCHPDSGARKVPALGALLTKRESAGPRSRLSETTSPTSRCSSGRPADRGRQRRRRGQGHGGHVTKSVGGRGRSAVVTCCSGAASMTPPCSATRELTSMTRDPDADPARPPGARAGGPRNAACADRIEAALAAPCGCWQAHRARHRVGRGDRDSHGRSPRRSRPPDAGRYPHPWTASTATWASWVKTTRSCSAERRDRGDTGLLAALQRLGVPIIAITGGRQSTGPDGA